LRKRHRLQKERGRDAVGARLVSVRRDGGQKKKG